jgi:urease accessory protein
MLRLEGIVGHVDDSVIAAKLHHLHHHGTIEHIFLTPADTKRKRLRIATDAGTDCAIALAREEELIDGSVLLIDDRRAIIVRLEAVDWLGVEPADLPAALELGYFVGNLHWRVRFDGARLRIALEGERAFYHDRLAPLLVKGKARILDGE